MHAFICSVLMLACLCVYVGVSHHVLALQCVAGARYSNASLTQFEIPFCCSLHIEL